MPAGLRPGVSLNRLPCYAPRAMNIKYTVHFKNPSKTRDYEVEQINPSGDNFYFINDKSETIAIIPAAHIFFIEKT